MSKVLRKLLAVVLAFQIMLPTVAFADIPRQRNQATRLKVVFRNSSTGVLITGAAGMNCKCKKWSDGSSPADLTTNCATSAPTEVGTTGIYYLPLTAGEVDDLFSEVLCTSSTTNAMPFSQTVYTKYGAVNADSTGKLDALGTQAKADVNAEVDSALDTAVPATPTANSLNDRIKKLTDSTGLFQAGSTQTLLALAASETANDISGGLIVVDTGTAAKDFCRVSAYNTSTKVATCALPLSASPGNGDAYTIIADADSSISSSQVASAVWDAQRSSYTTNGTFGQGVASVQGNMTGSAASVSGSVGSVVGACGSVTAAVTVGTNNDKLGYGISTTARDSVADQVWDELRSGHTGAGSFGQGVIVVTNSDKTGYSISGTKQTLDALNDVSGSTVLTQCTTALNSYDAPTFTEMTAGFTEIKGTSWSATTDTLHQIALGGGGGGGGASAAAVADAVWDELMSEHLVNGSFGKGIADALNTTLTCQATRQ